MDEALIENAQDDVDRDDGDGEQQAHIAHRSLERLGLALELALARWRACRSASRAWSISVTASDRAIAGHQVEGDGHRRQLAQMIDRQRHGARRQRGHRGERHHGVTLAGGGGGAGRCRRCDGAAAGAAGASRRRRWMRYRAGRCVDDRAGIAAAIPASPNIPRRWHRWWRPARRRTRRPARSRSTRSRRHGRRPGRGRSSTFDRGAGEIHVAGDVGEARAC